MATRAAPWKRLALGAALPLVLGAAVYLLLRPREAWFLQRLLDVPALGAALRAVRAHTVPLGAHVPARWLGFLPDLAWAFAVGALLAILWRGRPGRAPYVWLAIGAIATVGYELAQRWGWVPGTFDPYDVAAQAIGYAVGWLAHPPRAER